MPSTDYTFDRDMLYINDNKKTGTKLDKGLHLGTYDHLLWYEMGEMQEFLEKCEELNITPEIYE
jgi:hypothetical protein